MEWCHLHHLGTVSEKVVKKSKSVPMITTYNINVKETICKISNALGHKNFTIKILGKSVSNIGCEIV